VSYGAWLWEDEAHGVRETLPEAVVIAVIFAGRGLVPAVGGTLSAAVVFTRLMSWADEELSPDGGLLVIVARLLDMAAGLGVSRRLGHI